MIPWPSDGTAVTRASYLARTPFGYLGSEGGDGPMVHLGMAHLGTTQNVRMSWRVATFSLLECVGVTFCIFGWLVVGVGMWLAVRKRT